MQANKGSKLSFVFALIFFLMVSIWQFYPFLRSPAFNLIDDGVSIRVANELLSGDFNSVIEAQNGRIRPMYWFYFALVYLVSGANPAGYWIGQMIFFALTLFAIYILATQQLQSTSNLYKIFAIAVTISLFFVPAVSENIYRLGTAEVRQVFFILLFLLWLTKAVQGTASKTVGVLLFLIALLTKETSILLAAVTIVYLTPYLLQQYEKNKKLLCIVLFCTVSSLVFYYILTALKETATYSTAYALSIAQLKINFLMSRLGLSEVYYLLALFILSVVTRYVLFMKTQPKVVFKQVDTIFNATILFWRNNALLFASITAMLASLFFVFSWEHQLERYYYPVYVFLLIVLLLESKSILDALHKYGIRYGLYLALIPFIVFPMLYLTVFQKVPARFDTYIQRSRDSKESWFQGYQNSYAMISYLLENSVQIVYTSVDDYEVVYELGLYANNFNYHLNKKPIISPNPAVAENFEYVEYDPNPELAFEQDNTSNRLFIATTKKPAHFSSDFIKQDIFTQAGKQTNWYIWSPQ